LFVGLSISSSPNKHCLDSRRAFPGGCLSNNVIPMKEQLCERTGVRRPLMTGLTRFPAMVSTAYTRGRSREYRALQTLRKEGWLCSRSAASHGPVDVFAGRRGQTLLIQVKSGKSRVSQLDRRVLKDWAEAYRGRAEIWHFQRRKGLRKTLVHDASQGETKPKSDL